MAKQYALMAPLGLNEKGDLAMEDFLHLDQQLHDDEKLIRDTVAKFVTAQVLPIISDAYEQAQFPKQLIQTMAQLGLLGMTLPREYGGSEASYVSYGLVCQEFLCR